MPVPKFLEGFGKKGDANKFSWSTRLPEDAHQFMLDVRSEHLLQNNSETLRVAVHFMMKHYQEKAEEEGHDIGAKLKARLRMANAKRRMSDRQFALSEIHESLVLAEATDYIPFKTELLAAAQETAKAHDIPWPPPELPLLARDSEAKYVMDRLLATLGEQQANRISLRDLARVCKFSSDDLRMIISKLETENYLTTHQEQRSGPGTLWIQVPTYANCQTVGTVSEK